MDSIGKFYQENYAQVGLIKIKNKICLNGDELFFVAVFTKVSDEIFSISFGYFAVEDIPKLNVFSTLKTRHFFIFAKSAIFLSCVLIINHKPAPK